MIHTVTLNTGFDDVFVVGAAVGRAGTVLDYRSEPSGKGINMARAVRALGGDVVACGFVGGDDGDVFEDTLRASGIRSALVRVEGKTRHNLTLTQSSTGLPATHYRAEGFGHVEPAAVAALSQLLAHSIAAGDIVSMNGSLPGGLEPGTWARIGSVAVAKRARLLLDLQGEELRVALQQLPCAAAKPNEAEARAVVDTTDDHESPDQFVARCLDAMHDLGVQLPMVSRGAHGVWFRTSTGLWRARCAVSVVAVEVGAGDAFMAGLAWALDRGHTDEEAVRFGVAAAAAHVGGAQPTDLLDRANALLPTVEVETPDAS